ncbi:SLC13 family permease [Phycicoccus avicenniae]|uniref:SLC13 family permease n=1 Tax=Phycicoccus avicenniae TaxID=2828860 RepID=UPI003D2DDCB6
MHDVIALGVLALVFLVATVRSINMGALALVSAAVVGVTVFGVGPDEVVGGFPASLFVILVGVTYLFALAKNNGTVDWMVHASVRAVRGRVALVPWAMFGICAVIAGIGAATPATVAIVAPVGMGFAARYRISPVLMGMAITLGATGGSFSPIGIFGAITNGVVSDNDLPGNPALLFAMSVLACFVITVVAFVLFGGRELMSRGRDAEAEEHIGEAATAASRTATRTTVTGTPESAVEHARTGGAPTTTAPDPEDDDSRLNPERILTLVGLAFLAISALLLKFDVGFTALGVAVVLTLVFPQSAKGAVDKIAWGTVLLVGGIVTYVSLLQDQGTVEWLGQQVAAVGAPLVAALLICVIGAVVSAFASTTGILGALIPLAVPFLLTGQVGAVGLVIALAISSSVVDISPFSTNGALCVANAEDKDRDGVFRQLMRWGMSLVVVAPLVTWGLLVVPGWL